MSLFDVIPVFPNDTLFKRTSAEPGVSLRLRVLRMFLFLAEKPGRTSEIQKSAAFFPKKLKGGIPMLYLFLSALRAVLYEVAVCLLRGVCCA